MSLMTAIAVSATGLSAQRRRLEVLVSNLANSNTTQKAGIDPYRKKDVVFRAVSPNASFSTELDNAVQGVEVAGISVDQREPIKRYEPHHEHADADGFIYLPNINPMTEMANVMSATRSYEANLQAVKTAKEMAMTTLEILR